MKCYFASLLLAFTLLQGCAFAPGQHMDPSDVEDLDEAIGPVKLVQITQATVSQQQVVYKPEPVPQALLSYRPAEYRIGPGDNLVITVWEHAELTAPGGAGGTGTTGTGAAGQRDTNARVVRQDGTIYYPYVQAIQAGGLTVDEFRSKLQKALSRYINDAQVDVNIQNYGSQRVVLSGAFKNSGPQYLTDRPLSLVDAVSRAGGADGDANAAGLILKRDGQEYVIDMDTLNRRDSRLTGIYLKDGDELNLANDRGNQIYVLGEVLNPQIMRYGTSTFSLMQALGNVGGINQETADAQAIYVIRGAQTRQQQPATVFYLDAKKPVAFLLAQHFELQSADVVFVGPSGITRWNRFISQLLPSASVLATGSAVGGR